MNARLTNSVRTPFRNKASLHETLFKIPTLLWSLHCLIHREFLRHSSFLKDHEHGKVSNKREFCVSGDIDLDDMREKAKALGVTLNDYFLGAVSQAVSKVTNGREV